MKTSFFNKCNTVTTVITFKQCTSFEEKAVKYNLCPISRKLRQYMRLSPQYLDRVVPFHHDLHVECSHNMMHYNRCNHFDLCNTMQFTRQTFEGHGTTINNWRIIQPYARRKPFDNVGPNYIIRLPDSFYCGSCGITTSY